MVMVMKSILNYYYQIIIDDNKIDDNGSFIYNNHMFCLYEYRRNINEVDALLSLNDNMLSKNIKINKIIKNIFNQVITNINNKNYVLIEVNYEYIDNNNFIFIKSFQDKRIDILKRNDWGKLWSLKIDYIEYQLVHIKNSFPIVNSSINYYIGLAENAISYFNMLNLNNVPLYIEHRRFRNNNIYNPMELVIDYKVRDISEYIKNNFFNKIMTINDIKNYISKLYLDNIDYVLLYVRLLFPSYYFDIYEDVVNNNLDELELNKVIKLSSDYEKLLYQVYLLIENKTNILGINWINSKFM